MSHLIQADFSSQLIRAEAIFKQALKRLSDYTLDAKLKAQFLNDFGMNDIGKLFEIHRGKTVSQNEYNNVISNANRVNDFFNFIDNYIVQSFDLKINNYNNSVQNITKLWLSQNKEILDKALSETDDVNLKNYIVTAFKQNSGLTKEQLINKAKQLFQKTNRFKEQQIQENIERLMSQKNIKHSISKGGNKNTQEFIADINNKIASKEIDKTVRDRVLSSIIKIIMKQGFIVKAENVIEKGEYAVINAIKPDGKKTRFEVFLDGKFKYKYHQYKGLSCEKDIELFEKEFKNIYGVKLENKDILWSNPDRTLNQAHNMIMNKKIGE